MIVNQLSGKCQVNVSRFVPKILQPCSTFAVKTKL